MNNFVNINNVSINTTDDFCLKAGSSSTIDSFYLFIISPIGFIGFILNLICFIILVCQSRSTNANIIKYLQIYSLNSCILCLLYGFMFITQSPRFFSIIAFSDIGKLYRCKIFGYLSMTLYFFGNMLNILIVFDRLSVFLNEKLYNFNAKRSYTKCIIIFLMCIIINSPILISFKNENMINSTNTIDICEQTLLADTTHSFVFNLMLYFLRDILTLIVEIMITVLSYYYYANKIKNIHEYHHVILFNSPNYIKITIKDDRKKGNQVLLMTIYLSIVSIVFHLMVSLVIYIGAKIDDKHIIQYAALNLILVSSIGMKHFLNGFIIYKFMSKFNKKLRC